MHVFIATRTVAPKKAGVIANVSAFGGILPNAPLPLLNKTGRNGRQGTPLEQHESRDP